MADIYTVEFRDPTNGEPGIPRGEEQYFIVVVRRAHNGKCYTFPALYLNQFVLLFEDEPYEREITGWYQAEANSGGDDGTTYLRLLGDGDQLVRWACIPEWKDPAHD